LQRIWITVAKFCTFDHRLESSACFPSESFLSNWADAVLGGSKMVNFTPCRAPVPSDLLSSSGLPLVVLHFEHYVINSM